MLEKNIKMLKMFNTKRNKSISDKLNTSIKNKCCQIQAVTINTKTPMICIRLTNRWLWARKEKEKEMCSFHKCHIKISWDSSSFKHSWKKASKNKKVDSLSAKIDCLTIYSTNPSSWCCTASIPTSWETSWHSFRPAKPIYSTTSSSATSCF